MIPCHFLFSWFLLPAAACTLYYVPDIYRHVTLQHHLGVTKCNVIGDNVGIFVHQIVSNIEGHRVTRIAQIGEKSPVALEVVLKLVRAILEIGDRLLRVLKAR